jgi:hypothetical protein
MFGLNYDGELIVIELKVVDFPFPIAVIVKQMGILLFTSI